MSAIPPPSRRGADPSARVGQFGYQPSRLLPSAVPTQAQTLSQFWRSDSRVLPSRRRPRWAGLIAFWVGLLAAMLFFFEMFTSGVGGPLTSVALALGTTAGFFALVALVAGVGRTLGLLGGILALLANVYVWAWLGDAFA